MRAKSITGGLTVTTVALCVPAAVQAQPSGEARGVLRAGAARIDYTPRDAQLAGNFTGVLDPIFVRTVVLDNGSTRAALVAIDAGAIPADLYDKISARAAAGAEDTASAAADFGHATRTACRSGSTPASRKRFCAACTRRSRGCSRRGWHGARASRTST